MNTQEIKELKNRPLAELQNMRKERLEKLRTMKLDLAAGKVKNEAELRMLRKDIARIATFMTAAQHASTKA